MFVLCEFFEELMLLGFLSLLLTVLQDPIAGICIPMSVAATWHPCNDDPPKTTARKLEEYSDSGFIFRRQLATKGYDKCTAHVREKPASSFVVLFHFLCS